LKILKAIINREIANNLKLWQLKHELETSASGLHGTRAPASLRLTPAFPVLARASQLVSQRLLIAKN